MAVAIEMNFPGATLAQYDEVLKLMGLDDGSLPPGAIFHWAASTGDGIRIVDVWESQEQFDAFAHDQIGPFTAQVGLPGPPESTSYTLYNTLPN